MNKPFSRADAGVLFLMLWIILSVWSGFTIGIIFPLLVVLCAGGTYLIVRKGWLDTKPSSFPDASPFLWAGVFIVLIGLLLWQGGYDRSADVAPSFAANLINGKIPLTYLPFFDLPFFYPPGLPSVVSQLSSLGLTSYVWGWILGAIGFAAMIFYSSRWARLLGIAHGAFLVPLFFIGLRFPFVSLLTGEYAVLLGYGISMAAVWMGRERKELFVLGAVAATLLHPYAGLVAWIGGLIMLKWSLRDLAMGITVTALGVLPIISYQFLPLLNKSNNTNVFFSLDVPNLLTIFFVAGVVTVFFGLLGMARLLFLQNENLRALWRVWLLVGVGMVGVLLANFFPTMVFGGKIILFLGAGLALFSAHFFSRVKIGFSEKKISAVIFVAIISVLFFSNNIADLTSGSKISLEEANYSTWLADNYPVSGKKVLFLSDGHSKMAQYANTIPFDAVAAHFLTSVTYTVFSNSETMRIQNEAIAYREMFVARCAACAEQAEADFIVVNTRVFPQLSLPVLSEHNGFILYVPAK